jgi:hypothetical protein
MVLQHADGTLGTRFLAEMLQKPAKTSIPTPVLSSPETRCNPGNAHLDAVKGMQAATLRGLPRNFRMTAKISGFSGAGVFGMRLRRGSNAANEGYDLCVDPAEKTVRLHTQRITRSATAFPSSATWKRVPPAGP